MEGKVYVDITSTDLGIIEINSIYQDRIEAFGADPGNVLTDALLEDLSTVMEDMLDVINMPGGYNFALQEVDFDEVQGYKYAIFTLETDTSTLFKMHRNILTKYKEKFFNYAINECPCDNSPGTPQDYMQMLMGEEFDTAVAIFISFICMLNGWDNEDFMDYLHVVMAEDVLAAFA